VKVGLALDKRSKAKKIGGAPGLPKKEAPHLGRWGYEEGRVCSGGITQKARGTAAPVLEVGPR